MRDNLSQNQQFGQTSKLNQDNRNKDNHFPDSRQWNVGGTAAFNSSAHPVQQKTGDEEKDDDHSVQRKAGATSDVNANPITTGNLPDNIKTPMERSFGQSFSDVKVHQNSSKASDLGALAYTQGTDVHFAPGQFNPDSKSGLELIGHELTHVVQQKQGRVSPTVQAKGVMVNDDPQLEREADVMGNKAASGKSVGTFTQSANSKGSNIVQRYTDIPKSKQKSGEWNLGSSARVSDNGMAVTSNDYSHEAYAHKSLIDRSNNILKAKGSGIEISAGTKTIKGTPPEGGTIKTLHNVKPKIKASDSVSGTQNFWADCGRSSREVMGKTGTDTSPYGLYNKSTGGKGKTSRSKNPAVFRDEILVKAGLGSTPDEARKAYLKKSDKAREAFDKKYGINKYAAPGVGEAFVSRRDDKSTTKGFNFHWGGVIMVAGHDRITLENFAKSGTTYDTKDEDWYFETYGPASKKGQTFHEKNEGSVGEAGKNNTTMAASTQ
ncbi:DUF4157 domain-containing protein [Fulvivirga ulvae]|uniref:eCIS core domain-containing protein n=1 Tax=Fulvivirga ulvae TaxID=2904245 RepID=UPI001F321961|nr:DUF4157 domain-containing protein [Fulvivirga ulvae]UII34738.1 DUF4157 domain-containing protein [Fulvivirga ulvae]